MEFFSCKFEDVSYECDSAMKSNNIITSNAVESPMAIDETSSDSGIVGDKLPSTDVSPNKSCDVSFSFAATGNTPRSVSAERDMSANFSAGSFMCHLVLDDSVSSAMASSLPRNFSQLLDGSLSSENMSDSPVAVATVEDDGLDVANSASACEDSKNATCGRRRFGRAKSGRKLRFDLDCSPDSPATSGCQVSDKSSKSPSDVYCRQSSCLFDVVDEEESRDVMPTLYCGDDVMEALSRTDEQLHSLIGDLSGTCALPVVSNSKHPDLKTITPDTLVDLMSHAYADVIERFYVIDCRYPYEYDGGHIENAVNICSKQSVMSEFMESSVYRNTSMESSKRTVFVFHCEFSSERAPSLLRFLRNQDRAAHADSYPRLHYPELYLLAGGYKAFFETHVAHCRPASYRPMLHEDHTEDLRHFRTKSKSWNGSKSSRTNGAREGQSRLSAETNSRRKSLWV